MLITHILKLWDYLIKPAMVALPDGHVHTLRRMPVKTKA